MQTEIHTALLAALFITAAGMASAATVDDALSDYRNQGAAQFQSDQGSRLWRQEVAGPEGEQRSCTTCHGADLHSAGRHVKTDEPIDAMAPSVNPKRLTERREIEKWFLRNCKWTFGRECTAQEKGDILSYLRTQ